MAKKLDKVDRAFIFFSEHLRNSKDFHLNDLAKHSGWSPSTTKTYSTKRWAGFLRKSGDKFTVDKCFGKFSLDTFRQHHSQKDHVNKFFYQLTLDKAVNACISAIEIYNKPDFKFREESFSILMVNAWELLLKSRILQNNSDNIKSIYSKINNAFAKTKSGNPKTIPISKALSNLESSNQINALVSSNIKLLIEIRDESVHFAHNDIELAHKIQSIATASLKNFMTLATKWFGLDFNKYNFYLMPISFFRPTEVEGYNLNKGAKENFLAHLNKIEKAHENNNDPDFSVSLRLETKLVKTTSDEAIQIRVTDSPDAPEIQITEEDALRNYPHTYQDLCNIFRKRYKDFKQNKKFNEAMRNTKKQGDKFCKERRLDPNNPKSLYKMFYHSRIIEEFDKLYTRK